MVKRYQRGNKKQYIKEGHTTQWSKDTKEVIRNSISKNMDVNVPYNTMVKRYQRGNKKQ